MFDGGLYIVLAMITAIAITVLLRKKDQSGRNGKPLPPCFPSLPIVGSLPYVAGGLEVLPELFMKTAEKLGPVFSFYAGPRLALILNGKKAIEDAALRHAEPFADKPGFWTEAHIFNRRLKGLAFAHYTEAFKKNHRVILSVLKELGHGIGQVTEERILEQVDDLFREFRKHDGQAFDPRPVLIPVATGAVLSVLFGRGFQFSGTGHRKVADNASTFVENMDAAIDVAPLVRFLPKFRKKIAKMASSSDGLMQGLDDGVRFCKEAPDAELSLVKRFLEIEGPGYDHEDLLYSLRDFCLGGTGTVASTILWALLELANHPQIQRRIHQEVDEMLPGDRAPLLSDRPRLPYVEAVLLEVMRRHTMVPLSLPHATLRDTETCGYFVPKGCLVLMNIYSCHMDPKVWQDPENFRPERFLDEENNVIHRDKIMAFGVGKRTCIAELLGRQELFLFLTSIVQNFNVRPPNGQRSVTAEEDRGLTVTPLEFKVCITERRKNPMASNGK